MDLGNVIDKSQVDTRGRHSSVVKDILGVESNPMAGILPAPEKNCRMSTRVTPCLPVGVKSKEDQLSKKIHVGNWFHVLLCRPGPIVPKILPNIPFRIS